MVDQQPEEQRFVAIVQRCQVDVLLEAGRLAPEILEHPPQLLLLGEHAGRQQAAQMQRVTLGLRERSAFVERRVLQ